MFPICRWMQQMAATALVPGALLGLSGKAQAFDPSSCNDISSNAVNEFNVFRVDGGGADFGHYPHIIGAPQGNAVICWFSHGRVGVEGKVYADSPTGDPSSGT